MARRKVQLVCQHLEGISRKVLQSYPEIVRGLARGRHGIYALYRRDRLYYLGLATDLRQRLTQHLRDQHAQTWDRFSLYLTVGDDHISEIESLFLRISRPRGNKVTPGLSRSQNLLPGLRSQIKVRQQAELEDIAPRARPRSRKVQRVAEIGDDGAKKPVLAPFVTERFALRWPYKGKLHKATVRRDGSIRYGGKVCNSPSLAAKAVAGRPMNGWRCWRYERAPGDWVVLDQLRK